MPKIKKQRRAKTYKHNINRKRLNRKMNNVGKISCKPVDKAWDNQKTIKRNLKQMGLMFDPNESIRKSNVRQKVRKQVEASLNGGAFIEEEIDEGEIVLTKPKKLKKPPIKAHVAEELENEANQPTERRYQLPKGQVEFITYLLDKYGHDYKAMVRDKRNHYQETWKQLRAKVKTFMGIPEQYGPYLASRGLLHKHTDDLKIAKALMDDDSD